MWEPFSQYWAEIQSYVVVSLNHLVFEVKCPEIFEAFQKRMKFRTLFFYVLCVCSCEVLKAYFIIKLLKKKYWQF